MARHRYVEVIVDGECKHERLTWSENAGWFTSGSWPCGESPYPSTWFPRVQQPVPVGVTGVKLPVRLSQITAYQQLDNSTSTGKDFDWRLIIGAALIALILIALK